MFEPGGICAGYHLRAVPDRYFLAQAFTLERADLRLALAAALAEFGMQPLTADEMYWPGHILCKIGALIRSTPFGIYQLTVNQNRNVYLELGMAMGLGRPFILVKDRDAEVSPLTQGLEYYSINSYLELRYELGEKVRPFLTDIACFRPSALPPVSSQRTAVLVHGDLDVLDFCVPVAKILKRYNLTPIILGDPTGKLTFFLSRESIPHVILDSAGRVRLEEVAATIQSARLGIYRIDKSGTSDGFVALGMSMGLNRPGLLIHHAADEPPTDVQGLGALKYTATSGLERAIEDTFGSLLQRYS
jgi:hypothetical protein